MVDSRVPDVVDRECGTSRRRPVCLETQRSGEEGGHLGTGHRLIGAVAGVGRRVAAQGDPRRGDAPDSVFEEVPVVLSEPVFVRRRVVEGAGQHCGHLASGHFAIGAELGIARRVAAPGDAGGGESIDHVLEEMAGVIVEVIDGGRRKLEGPRQEGRHSPAVDRVSRAETVIDRGIAATGDALGGDGLDRSLVSVAVVIDEGSAGREQCSHGSEDEGDHPVHVVLIGGPGPSLK